MAEPGRARRGFQVAVGLLLVVGCQRGASDHSAPAPSASVVAQAPSAAPAAPTPAKVEPIERARSVVAAWDAALNRHDAAALASLYADPVDFYGQLMPRAKLIEAKRKALAATPDFAQKLTNLNLAPEGDTVLASFDKQSGSAKAQKSVPARLRLEKSGESYVIGLESDAPSDAKAGVDLDCEGMAGSIVNALPQVAKFFRDAPPDASVGGLTYEADAHKVVATIGYHHEDRFESVFHYSVENGKLEVSGGGDDIVISPRDQARIRAKCQ